MINFKKISFAAFFIFNAYALSGSENKKEDAILKQIIKIRLFNPAEMYKLQTQKPAPDNDSYEIPAFFYFMTHRSVNEVNQYLHDNLPEVLSSRNYDMNTALHYATILTSTFPAEDSKLPVLLLNPKMHALVNVQSNLQDRIQNTPLDIAIGMLSIIRKENPKFTDKAISTIKAIRAAGGIIANKCPILNDHESQLFKEATSYVAQLEDQVVEEIQAEQAAVATFTHETNKNTVFAAKLSPILRIALPSDVTFDEL